MCACFSIDTSRYANIFFSYSSLEIKSDSDVGAMFGLGANQVIFFSTLTLKLIPILNTKH